MSDDPLRLIETPDAPAHLVELVRRLEPPPVPPAIRASVRARLPGHRVSPPWRVVGPTLAVVTAVGIGSVAWSLHRTPPQRLPAPAATAPAREADASSAVDAAIAPPDAGTEPASGPGLDARAVRATVTASMQDVQRCLAADVAEGETRAFTVDVVITAAGRVRRARFLPPGPRRGAECALALARAWRFPAAQGDTHTQVPFTVHGAPSARDAPPEQPSEVGYLVIQSLPWAHVFIDGRDAHARTPVRRMEVPAGRHVIGLRTEDGVMHEARVDVAAGETTRIVRQLGESRTPRPARPRERVPVRPRPYSGSAPLNPF